MSKYFSILLLFFLFSCKDEEKTKELNKSTINELLINNAGDTVVTGKYIDFNYSEVPLDSLVRFKEFTLNQAKEIKSPFDIGKSELEFIQEINVSEVLESTKDFKKTNKNFQLINYKGDKITTNSEKKIIFNETQAQLPIEQKISGFSRKDSDLSNFNHISTTEGLGTGFRDFVFKKNGELILGSDINGIQFLNSKNLEIYNDKNGFQTSSIYSVIELKSGEICTGSWGGGVTLFDGKKFKNINPNNGLSSDIVTSLLEDSKGNIWIGTWGGGLAKLKDNKLTHFALESGVSSLNIVSIFEDSKGRIWFGTFGGGITYFENNQFFNLAHCKEITQKGIMAFAEDKNDNVYFGSWGNGLFKISKNKIFKIQIPDPNWDLFISSLHFDKFNNLWVGTVRNGLYRIDNQNKTTHFNNKNGFSINNVISINEDLQNNIWFSVFGDGLYKYNENSFKIIKDFDKNEELIIGGTTEDKKNNKIYFGSINSQGLFVKQNDSFYKIQTNGLNFQMYNLSSYNDELFISTGGQGMIKLSNNKAKQFLFNNLESNMINTFFIDKNKKYWIGGNTGIHQLDFKTKKIKKYDEKSGLSTIWIFKIAPDNEGNLWVISHGGGISKIVDNKIMHFSQKEGLKSNYVNNFYVDDENRIWVATTKGISIIYNDKIVNFKEFDQFNDFKISSILQDKYKNFWLSTSNGVYALKIKFNSTNKSNLYVFQSTLFNFENGLKSTDMFNNSMHIDENNVLWLGTGIDLVYKDLNKFKFPKNTESPIIRKIEIKGTHYLFNDSLKKRNKKINFTEKIDSQNLPENLEIDYSQNHLTFYFSSIDNFDNEKIKYSYKIEGIDNEWSKPSNENKADYKNLPYGDFIFKVKSSRNNNSWSEQTFFKFTVLKPFWATWWFRFLIVVLFILIFYVGIKLRTRKLIEKQIQLEKIVDERTKELKEEKLIVEEKNKEILDSITYAKRIQSAILPQPKLVKQFLEDSFILYKPKDIVAGDFYWLEVVDDTVMFAAADCTGHGVPGAMVSVVCNNGLNRSVREFGLLNPNEILDKTREIVLQEFEKSDEDVKDGMDISLCVLDTKTNILKWSGANNPLWILRENEEGVCEVLETKADKQPIGKYSHAKPFIQYEIKIKKNDIIYIFTDGYQDQFGGEKEKKFRASQMRELFLSLTNKTMEEQRIIIDDAFESWKGNLNQIDDVCIIGVRF